MASIPKVGSRWRPKPDAPRWCKRRTIEVAKASRKSVRFIGEVTEKGSVVLCIYTLEAFLRDYRPVAEEGGERG